MDGLTVSKFVETINFLDKSLNSDETTMIQNHVKLTIKTVTD